jgi:hypothetical protein
MIRKSLLVVLLLLLAGAGGLASAQPQTIRFDQCVPQSTCVVDVVTFTGGLATYTNSAYSDTQGPMYHSSGSNNCIGCTNLIKVRFATEVSDVKFSVENGWQWGAQTVIANSDTGAQGHVIVPMFRTYKQIDPPWRQLVLPGSNHREINITGNIYNGCIRHEGRDYCYANWWDYAIDDFIYTKTPADTRIVFGTRGILGMGDPLMKNLPRTSEVSATFPLGAEFFARLERRQGNNWVPILASSELTNVTVKNQNTLEGRALFPGHPIIAYNRFARENEKVFQGIHYGTATLTLITGDQRFPRVSMKITINAPARLGHGSYVDGNNATIPVNYQYDATILDRAHKTGIPPQWMKAQIEKEANFNPVAYRYELATRDWDKVQDRTHAYYHGNGPYVLYRMGDGAQLCNPDGVATVPNNDCAFRDLNDIEPRKRYRILRNGQPDNIRPTDGVVTIRQIVDADNDRYGWFPKPKPLDPILPAPTGRRRAVRHPDPLNVPAQTTIASSYGMMQLVYTDLIDRPFRWQGINGRYNPTLFFDTAENHQRGGGSFIIGSQLALLKWGGVNPDPVNPSYGAPADFAAALREMYIEYNGASTYGPAVEARVPHYMPIPSAAIVAPLCEAQGFSAQSREALLTPGGNAILGVAIDADDVEYQWFSGSPSNPISGETGQSLTVNSPGTYWCRAKTECGAILSDPIVVSTAGPSCNAPSMRVQPPVEKTVMEGMTTSFGAEVNGTGLRYQWFEGDPAGAPGSTIGAFEPHPDLAVPLMGETAPTITVQPETTTTYFLYAENTCGAVLSNIVKVTVQPCVPVTISAQSGPTTIVRGESTTVSIAPEGTAPHGIQWYVGTPGNAMAIEGATGPEHLATPNATTTYFASVTNRCGTVTSSPVLITVNEPCVPAFIGAQSASTTIIRGESATLSLTPAGSTPRTIQWYRGTTAIDGATNATYLATPDESTTYSGIVTNACGEASSTPITVIVDDACVPASIAAQSSSATNTRGESTMLSVTPAGSTPRTIQWYAGASVIDGANAPTYEASPTATTTYRAVVTNECGEAASTPVTVTVVEPCIPATISSQSSSVTIVSGDSTMLSIVPGGSTPRSIQWYQGTPASFLRVDGATASTFVIAPIATVSYFAVVTNQCGSATSIPVTITVTTACVMPSLTAQSGSTSIVRGESTTLSVTASGTAPRTAQWYTGTPANASYIEGATDTTYAASPNATTSYFAIISNACGATNSSPVTITVTDACVPATIASQSNSTSISSGESALLSVTASGTSPRTIQWYIGTPSSPSLIVGASSASHTVSPAVTTSYFARVSNSCGSDDSSPVTITVDCSRPSITAHPQSHTIEEGQLATLSVGYDGATSVQWYSDEQSFFAPISGATSSTLQRSPSATHRYFARVTNSCGSTDSATATITVNPPSCNPVFITQQPANRSITEGQSATLTVGATGTNLQYQWQQNISGVWTNLTGKTTFSLTVTPPAGTHQYRVMVSNACGLMTSGVVTVTVGVPCTPPHITQQPVDPTFTTIGQSATLTVGATGSNLQYQWYRNGTLWDVATGPSIQVFAATTTDRYYCVVSNACGSETSIEITVESLCGLPQVTIVYATDPVVPPGGSSVLAVSSSGTPLLHWTLYERPVGGVATAISSGKGINVPNATVIPPATSDYWYEVTNECGSSSSNVVRITVG